MNNKFKILWLDDEFIKDEDTDNIPLSIIRHRYPDFDIESVSFTDVCKKIMLSHGESFNAVILDANGKPSNEPNAEATKYDFQDLINTAKKIKIPVYIFSGELSPKETGDLADVTKHNLLIDGFVEEHNLFYKSGTYKLLLDKILDDLKNDYYVFYDYPEIFDNVLHYNVNKECCKKLLLWMKNKDHNEFPQFVDLRRIIFDEAYDGRLKKFFGVPKIASIKKDQITGKCMEPWEKDVILDLFKDLVNSNVHDWPSDNKYMQEVVANSFIIAMKWFNRFMHNIESNSNITEYYTGDTNANTDDGNNADKNTIQTGERIGTIEKDSNGFYHVGAYLLKSSWASKNVNRKVKVTKEGFFNYKKIAYQTEFI